MSKFNLVTPREIAEEIYNQCARQNIASGYFENEIRKELLCIALERNRDERTAAAKALKLQRTTFVERLRKFGIR